MVRRLFTLLFFSTFITLGMRVVFANECIIGKGSIPSGGEGLVKALDEASKGKCTSDASNLRNRYDEFFPGVTEFQVIRWNIASEVILNDDLPEIENNNDMPLVIIADDDVSVKVSGNDLNTAFILKGNRIVIDHLTVEGFRGNGIVIEGDKDVVINCSVISNNKNGILVTGKNDYIVASEIAQNGINGIFVGGSGAGQSCGGDAKYDAGRGAVISYCNIHENGAAVSGTSCADTNNPNSFGPCWSLKLETERCFDLLQGEHPCDEPQISADDSCGHYWNARKRCNDLWAKASVAENASKEEALTAVNNAFPGAQGGSGIVVDAPGVKLASLKSYQHEIGKDTPLMGQIYKNHSKGIYVNTLPVGVICKDPSSAFDTNMLQTALVSETYVDDLSISRFPLPTVAQIAANQGQKEITVSGALRLPSELWFPWNSASLNNSALHAEIYVKNGDNGMFVGEGSIDESGHFIVHIPSPIVINGETLQDPSFVASLVDSEHGNTSPFTGNSSASPSGDDDNDGLPNDQEDINHNGIVDPGETDPLNPDTDGDGLTDGEEKLHIGRVADLLAKGYPFAAIEKLDPLNSDSDGDCLPDGLELGITKDEAGQLINRMPKKPHLVISAQCQAILKAHTITTLENSIKVNESTSATWDNIAMLYDSDPTTITDPTNPDTDNDKLKDGEEDINFNGLQDFETLPDGTKELKETDPNNSDTDGDGLLDGDEGDINHNGKLDISESDPLKADTDGDGVNDGDEHRIGTYPNLCDSDGDGLSDGVEVGAIKPASPGSTCHGLEAAGTNYRHPHTMNPLNPDSDGDGLLDGEEDKNGNGWVDPTESDPSNPDSDGDGLNDYIEATGDFDGDGLPDFDVKLITAGPKCSPPPDISDVDCDGIPNAVDLDSDNDGCPDSEEGGWRDQNSNSIPDVYDNEAKNCTTSGGSVGGGAIGQGGSNTSENNAPQGGATSQTPAWMLDKSGGGICTLINDENRAPNSSTNTLVIVIYIFVISALFISRLRIKHPSALQ